jgi:hypothetical protein
LEIDLKTIEELRYSCELARHKTQMAKYNLNVATNAALVAEDEFDTALTAEVEAMRELSLARGYKLIEENS